MTSHLKMRHDYDLVCSLSSELVDDWLELLRQEHHVVGLGPLDDSASGRRDALQDLQGARTKSSISIRARLRTVPTGFSDLRGGPDKADALAVADDHG